MRNRFTIAYKKYPSQFWLLIVGMFVGMIGTSMIWPFLMIYVSEKLQLPLADIAGLISLNGIVSLAASYYGGTLSDRFGRKSLLVISLLGNGLSYFSFIYADTYLSFALLMSFRGIFNPLYRVGLSAMISDLVPPEDRTDAYALQRLASNSGIAIGPAIGGFVVVSSFSAGFTAAACTLSFFAFLIILFAKETLPVSSTTTDGQPDEQTFSGYRQVFKDRHFLQFNFGFMLMAMTMMLIWVLLAVYAKQNYQLPESQYGFIQAANAAMVVLFQMPVIRAVKRFRPLGILTAGALIYGISVGSIALGTGFWAFLGSVVFMTVGELIAMPIATTFAANLAPTELRGRYMGIFTLTQGLASSIAPLLGGLLNDHIGPKAIWYGGGLIGLLSALVFWRMYRKEPDRLNGTAAI